MLHRKKVNVCVCLTIVCLLSCIIASGQVIVQTYSCKIKVSELKQYGYGAASGTPSPQAGRQVITSAEEAAQFVNNLYIGKSLASLLGQPSAKRIGEFISQKINAGSLKDWNNRHSSMIFLQHPVDVDKLNRNSTDKRKGLICQAQTLGLQVRSLTNYINKLDSLQLLLISNNTRDLTTLLSNGSMQDFSLTTNPNSGTATSPTATTGSSSGTSGLPRPGGGPRRAMAVRVTARTSTTTPPSTTPVATTIISTSPFAVVTQNNIAVKDLTDLIQRMNEQLKQTKEEYSKVKDKYENTYDNYVEEKEVQSFAVHGDFKGAIKSATTYDSYMLDTDEVLIVALGGADDLRKATITIDNHPSSFQASLTDFISLAGTVVGGSIIPQTATAAGTVDCIYPEVFEEQLVDVSFYLLNQSKIHFPSDIKITHSSFKEDIKYIIHESNRALIKVGYSASLFKDQNLRIDPNNLNNSFNFQYTDTQKATLKGNIVAMLDIAPWGRDLDRLQPIWEKDQKTNLLDRLGIYVGLKLSNDPFQAIHAGGSLFITKDVSLNLGLAFLATDRFTGTIPTNYTYNQALDYIQQNAGRVYNRTELFVGLSFAPSRLSKILGITKE